MLPIKIERVTLTLRLYDKIEEVWLESDPPFFYSSELHFNDWDGSKLYQVACPPATVLPGENGYAKTRIGDFPQRIGYIVIFP